MAVQNNASSTKKIDKTKTSKGGFVSFLKELKSEFKRITWASKDHVKKATATVLTFCLIYMLIVGLFDFGFRSLFQIIFK